MNVQWELERDNEKRIKSNDTYVMIIREICLIRKI